MTTVLVKDFNKTDIHFHPVTFNDRGAKVVNISYDKNSTSAQHRIKLQVSTDKEPLYSLWKLSEPRNGEDGKRRNFELKLENEEILQKLKEFDQYVIDYACEHAREWFKKDLKREQIEAKYNYIVKEPNDDKNRHCHTMIIKINCPPTDNVTPIKKILDDNLTLEDGSIDDLTQNAEVIPVIRTSGVWFMSDQFGISFSAHKLIVKPSIPKAFVDDFILEKSYVCAKAIINNLETTETGDSMDESKE